MRALGGAGRKLSAGERDRRRHAMIMCSAAFFWAHIMHSL
jgi:hypothetical protein